jgi:hypothetical protein
MGGLEARTTSTARATSSGVAAALSVAVPLERRLSRQVAGRTARRRRGAVRHGVEALRGGAAARAGLIWAPRAARREAAGLPRPPRTCWWGIARLPRPPRACWWCLHGDDAGRGWFAEYSVRATSPYLPCEARRLSRSYLSLAHVANWWHGPAWAPTAFLELYLGSCRCSVWEVAGEVRVAGSWRSDDDDIVWQPRCGFPSVSVLRVGSQVGYGGMSNVVVFHNDIGVLYGFLVGSPVNEPVNSLLLFNKMRKNYPFC